VFEDEVKKFSNWRFLRLETPGPLGAPRVMRGVLAQGGAPQIPRCPAKFVVRLK
jgi:hypothetical protein